MDYDEWEEKYKPIRNPESKFEDNFVWGAVPEGTDGHYVWSEVCVDGWDTIVPGYAVANRIGNYFITEVAWESGLEEVIIESPEDENWNCQKCRKYINWYESERNDGLCDECAAKKEEE